MLAEDRMPGRQTPAKQLDSGKRELAFEGVLFWLSLTVT